MIESGEGGLIMFNQYPNQKLGRWLLFLGGLLILGVAIVALVSTDWIKFLLIAVLSSIFFIPAFIFSEKSFYRFAKTLDRFSLLTPIIRFFIG
ncbi:MULTISPECIES: hypothetical protein [unclassified Pseudomonas]|uniref:hypothetical protein n=1 Tax=unclassified Pseudomonas TaxID=196821 RepID=UPI000CD25DCC|nr:MULTISPECIES: hypothetical protein [unclassified Pseudomonas]POA54884.1 hypothetical protein C1889_15260 [Pseudomonas sp. FW507-12TSA]